MSTTVLRRSKIVFILSLLFILSVLTAPSFADRGDPVVVVSHAVDGSAVHVTVKNNSRQHQVVDVFVDAVVGSSAVRGFTPVSVFPGATGTTVVGFSDVVESVDQAGIIDDGHPQ